MSCISHAIRGLYFVTAEYPEHGRTHEDLALQAATGGARVIQYREKERTTRYFEAAQAVRDVCVALGKTFIVNDDPELAEALDADGLHLGQSDLDRLPAYAGSRERILGISVSTVAEALRAVELGAHYLGVGPVFVSPTKPDAVGPIGLEGLRAVREAVDVPIAAIGGLDEGNIAEVMAAGADAVCVVSAIAHAADPLQATARLAETATATARKGGAA